MTMSNFVVGKNWTDKDSKVRRFRELYEKNDFIEAYSQHTDLRMKDDPKWAIGRGDEWESHGLLQLEFLKAQGLLPTHRMLDVGCGPGRAARRIVPYLEEGNYWGVDISGECLKHAAALSESEGWASKNPTFKMSPDLSFDSPRQFDFIWAHSVFTHLPEEQISKMLENMQRILAVDGKFLFTYKLGIEPERTGLKQFKYPHSFFLRRAEIVNMKFCSLQTVWPASQRTGLMKRTA